jgi:hypothetical protein
MLTFFFCFFIQCFLSFVALIRLCYVSLCVPKIVSHNDDCMNTVAAFVISR